jgi:hypothetical protein
LGSPKSFVVQDQLVSGGPPGLSDSVEEIRLPSEGALNVEFAHTLEGDYVGPADILQMIIVMSQRSVVQQVFDVNGMKLVYILRYQGAKSGWYVPISEKGTRYTTIGRQFGRRR